jgi:dTDP-4-dehydrorhamnose 3,5-epimerase-like enzyme
MTKVEHCQIINIKKISSHKGSLSAVESDVCIPFNIKRIYFTYDIPSGAERGGHAHIHQHEIVIAASGSFEVVLDDGFNKNTIFLNSPNKGLHIMPGIWRELKNFSTGSVVLVMASDVYQESDYIRDYIEFERSI